MSEVEKYRKLIGEHPNSNWCYVVRESDFDRVTSERDAARAAEQLLITVNKDLQQRLTAADERADVLEELLREVDAACDLAMSAIDHDERGANFVRIIAAIKAKAVPKRSDELVAQHAAIDFFDAALKPAEAPRNQCDGCQAGIPLINGTHRMGREGGYPDFMGCSAKLYKPAEGGGDE